MYKPGDVVHVASRLSVNTLLISIIDEVDRFDDDDSIISYRAIILSSNHGSEVGEEWVWVPKYWNHWLIDI